MSSLRPAGRRPRVRGSPATTRRGRRLRPTATTRTSRSTTSTLADADHLARAALAHWRLGAQRAAGDADRRGPQPHGRSEGWDSPHTVVDIVNDDMPFLVDSVTMALDRHDLGIHLVVHPVLEVRRDARHARRRSTTRARPIARVVAARRGRPRDRRPTCSPRCTPTSSACSATSRAATSDWPKMLAALDAVADDLDERPPPSTPTSSPRAARCCAGWPTSTSRSSATASTTSTRRRRRRRAPRGPGQRPRHPARRTPPSTGRPAGAADSFSKLPPAIRAKARERTLLVLTKANAALDRAPPDVPRLRRREALRRRRQRDRRAPLPRPLHVVGVPLEPDRHPGAAAQGRRR